MPSLEKITTVRIPPQYGSSHMFDWEWAFADSKSHKCLHHYDQSNMTLCYRWEMQLYVNTGAQADEGYHFTHPWEGYLGYTFADLPPAWFPIDFDTAKFIAWDKEPIEYITYKQIQSDNSSYRNQTGKPKYYFRRDELSNEFYLYPKPAYPVFDDITGDAINGQVLFDSDNTDSGDVNQEDGTIIDITNLFPQSTLGIATDEVIADDNILIIYVPDAVDIESMDDEPSYPKWIQKYIEYGAIERAYKANTDGKTPTLAEYWAWRKELGVEVIKQFKFKQRTDRDYRLTSKDGMAFRNRKGPRLPDTYPATPQ